MHQQYHNCDNNFHSFTLSDLVIPPQLECLTCDPTSAILWPVMDSTTAMDLRKTHSCQSFCYNPITLYDMPAESSTTELWQRSISFTFSDLVIPPTTAKHLGRTLPRPLCNPHLFISSRRCVIRPHNSQNLQSIIDPQTLICKPWNN
jgi:hypothetical protein